MQQCCPPPRIKWRCQACEVGVGEGRVMNQNLYGDGGHLYPNGFFFFKLVLGIFSDSRGRGRCVF